MSLFIVKVTCSRIDVYGQELFQVADPFVPVEAADEAEACQRAVLWHADNGTVVEDEDLLWKVDEAVRGVSFKATKCLRISESELGFFLSVTQGLTTAIVIGRPAAR